MSVCEFGDYLPKCSLFFLYLMLGSNGRDVSFWFDLAATHFGSRNRTLSTHTNKLQRKNDNKKKQMHDACRMTTGINKHNLRIFIAFFFSRCVPSAAKKIMLLFAECIQHTAVDISGTLWLFILAFCALPSNFESMHLNVQTQRVTGLAKYYELTLNIFI